MRADRGDVGDVLQRLRAHARALFSWLRDAPRSHTDETQQLFARALALFQHEPLARLQNARDLLLRTLRARNPHTHQLAHRALLVRWRLIDPREEARLAGEVASSWQRRVLYAVIAQDDDVLSETLAGSTAVVAAAALALLS